MKTASSSSLVPNFVTLAGESFDEKFVLSWRMASAIIGITMKQGKCGSKDLLSLGFSNDEIGERWHMAHAMASVELHLMAARN
ncbi:MAG: hypothetical protein PHQ46_07890 [Negativicutes bacterium]|nr:hypothetical protein [Negativicutes bacterium]